MASMSRMNCLGAAVLVAFIISGCQSSNNKWATAWKERSKPKANFQGLDGAEEVTYWPYKPGKDKKKMTAIPNQLKDKIAQKSEQTKNATELAELIKAGDQLRKNGQYEDARLAYNKALFVAPESSEVRHKLAIVADMQHQYADADDHYQAALRSRPRDVDLLSDLGYSYMLRGDTRQAEQTLKGALAINRAHKGAMANLGSLYSKQNRYPEALAMFREGATEAEAQQYIAKLFPQGRSTELAAFTEQGRAPAGPTTGAPASDAPLDMSKLSFEQIQQEMARRKQESEQSFDLRRRQEAEREYAQLNRLRGDDRTQQAQVQQQQRMAQANPGYQRENSEGSQNGMRNGDPTSFTNNQTATDGRHDPSAVMLPGSNSRTQAMNAPHAGPPGNSQSAPPDFSFRAAPGTAPSIELFQGLPVQGQSSQPDGGQVQQALGQMPASANPIQQTNAGSASQMATQLGMSAGPGSMFPIVTGPPNPGAGYDAMGPAARSSAGYENRFGSEYEQPPNYQPQPGQLQPGMPANRMDQAPQSAADGSGHADGLPSLAPASPASNWGPLSGGALNWQNGAANNTSWASDTQTSGAAGTGVAPASAQSGWDQTSTRRSENPESFAVDRNPSSRGRSGTEGSRPYNGVWPNPNAIPNRQTVNPSVFTRSPESLEMLSINPMAPVGGDGPMNSSAMAPNAGNGSTPPWPFAPNRQVHAGVQ